MSGKRLSKRFPEASKPSSERIEETVKSANKIVTDLEESKQSKRNKKKAALVGKVSGELKDELQVIKSRYAPFKNNTTLAMQEEIVKLLSYGSAEFGLSQKELAAIAISRFLEDVKEHSPLLKTYM